MAGRSGTKLTARMIRDRLDRELVANVSLRVLDTDRPDTWEVQGRGEMQFAILAEMMRREGFELTIGKPRVVTREVDGKLHEPVERVSIDVPEEYTGVVIQSLALRKGRMESMTNHGTGWVRLEHLVPARGLLGFRSEFQTETRGSGQLHHVFEGYERWAGDIKSRPNGSLIADRSGQATGYSIQSLQERGSLFVGPGTDVYEGMIVGENSRSGDLDVNITKAKQMTNVRSNADVLVRLNPPRTLSLDQAIEYIQEGECVEVTPADIRLRRAVLSASERNSQRSKAARGVPSGGEREPRHDAPAEGERVVEPSGALAHVVERDAVAGAVAVDRPAVSEVDPGVVDRRGLRPDAVRLEAPEEDVAGLEIAAVDALA